MQSEQTKFEIWADEVNKEWIGGYSATATENGLSIMLNNQVVACITSDFTVAGRDTVAIEQLEYMVSR